MKTLNQALLKHLQEGTVFPAHPLALNADRTINEEIHLSKEFLR